LLIQVHYLFRHRQLNVSLACKGALGMVQEFFWSMAFVASQVAYVASQMASAASQLLEIANPSLSYACVPCQTAVRQ